MIVLVERSATSRIAYLGLRFKSGSDAYYIFM